MRPARAIRRPLVATAAAAATAALALSLAGPAGAAARTGSAAGPAPQATPGWSVSQTFGPADGEWGDTFAADSASDAWTTWNACSSCGAHPANLSYFEQWNGAGWSPVAVPSNLAKYAKHPLAIGASSASDAWLFDVHSMLRFIGSTWSRTPIPAWVTHVNLSGNIGIDPVVFGPDSAWVFNLGVDSFTSPDHYVAEYNGTRWSKVTLPAVPSDISVVAADDIWALGVTPSTATGNDPDWVVMHWNGTTWSSVPLPTVTPPKGTAENPGSLAGTGPSDVWVPWYVTRGAAGAQTKYLLHWNGASWVKVKLGLPINSVNSLAQDGHGGLWLADNGPAPDYTWYLDHLNHGTWTRYTVPAAAGDTAQQVIGLTWIPATHSVWAQGDMTSGSSDIYGDILEYTP